MIARPTTQGWGLMVVALILPVNRLSIRPLPYFSSFASTSIFVGSCVGPATIVVSTFVPILHLLPYLTRLNRSRNCHDFASYEISATRFLLSFKLLPSNFSHCSLLYNLKGMTDTIIKITRKKSSTKRERRKENSRRSFISKVTYTFLG